MDIFVDIIIILLIIGNALIGYKVGFTKVIVNILSSIIAIVLVFILYKPVTNFVYNNTELAQKIEGLITEEVMQNSSNSLATYATDKVSYNIISGIVYFALFAVIRMILTIVKLFVGFLTDLPIIKTVDGLLRNGIWYHKGIFYHICNIRYYIIYCAVFG